MARRKTVSGIGIVLAIGAIKHPAVFEAAVAGVPAAEGLGDRVQAFVVLKPAAKAGEEEILEFCRASLAPFKVPKVVTFLPELPKSAVGKILRRQLAQDEIVRRNGTGPEGGSAENQQETRR